MKFWNRVPLDLREPLILFVLFTMVWYLCTPVLDGGPLLIFRIGWTAAAAAAIVWSDRRNKARALNLIRRNWK